VKALWEDITRTASILMNPALALAIATSIVVAPLITAIEVKKTKKT